MVFNYTGLGGSKEEETSQKMGTCGARGFVHPFSSLFTFAKWNWITYIVAFAVVVCIRKFHRKIAIFFLWI